MFQPSSENSDQTADECVYMYFVHNFPTTFYTHQQVKIISFIYMVCWNQEDQNTKFSKICLKRPLKKDQNWVFKTDYLLMQVKSIAECSKRAFCNTFDVH